MANRKHPAHEPGAPGPSIPNWQSAARPSPVQLDTADIKPRKPQEIGKGARSGFPRARRRAQVRSKPLKLDSRREKRAAIDIVWIAVRACVITLILILPMLLLTGSAPLEPLPDAESRFEDWREAQNAAAIRPLPDGSPISEISDSD